MHFKQSNTYIHAIQSASLFGKEPLLVCSVVIPFKLHRSHTQCHERIKGRPPWVWRVGRKVSHGRKARGEKPTQIGPMNFIDNMPVNKQELNTLGDLQWVPIDFKNDITPAPDISRKWSAKYTMGSHLDAVTCVGFHPSEPLLVTGSEDKTLKIWNMQQKSSQPRR